MRHQVTYVSQNKDSHLLEVPESAVGRVPSSFSLVSNLKLCLCRHRKAIRKVLSCPRSPSRLRDHRCILALLPQASQKKGFKRYMTEALKVLVKGLNEAQEEREKAMDGILQVCVFV